MKALSFVEPWCHCVLHRGKRVDNRKQNTKHRGPLLLHASLTVADHQWRRASELIAELGLPELPRLPTYARGQIVGCTSVLAVIPPGDWVLARHLAEVHAFDLGWWFPDQYGYVLAERVEIFEPGIPCKGALGIWQVPDAVAALVPLSEDVDRLTSYTSRDTTGS